MSIDDEIFFTENITNVNRIVEKILCASALVPLSFLILTLAGVWVVPYSYTFILMLFCVVTSAADILLNRTTRLQIVSMYFGLTAATVFVGILGLNSTITISIAYGFVPFLSCLYYNRKLTAVTTALNYMITVGLLYIRSKNIQDVYVYVNIDQTPFQWFLSSAIGYTVEFIFVTLITMSIANRTHRPLMQLIKSMTAHSETLIQLRKKNSEINSINAQLVEKNRTMHETQEKIIQFVGEVLGSHDLFTGRHVMHTKKYLGEIALELRNSGHYTDVLTDRTISTFSTAACLHDIGKIHIPEGILNKPGKFTEEEFEIMKCHPAEGAKLLEFLPKIDDGTFNTAAREMALYHHEKWDGSGYPEHKKGTEIPLCARLMAAADVFDALVSRRLYKDPMPTEQAVEIFRKSSGTHFEPCIADAVIKCSSRLDKISMEFKESESEQEKREAEWWDNYHSKFSRAR